MFVGLFDVEVLIGTVGVEERGTETHLHDVLTEAFEEVDGTGHPCVPPEGYQSVAVLVSYLFVVNQSNSVLQYFVQSRHVVRLGLSYSILIPLSYAKKISKSCQE